MTKNEVSESLRSFLTNELLVDFDHEVNDDTDLFDAGLVDSYGFIELIGFIELKYSISFTDEELMDSPMNTLRSLCDLVTRKNEER